jgi:hypothetical protein
VVCVLAVARRPVSLELLAAVVRADTDSTSRAVADLRRRNLVYLSGDELVQFTTERWSDAVSAVMEPAVRTRIHLRLAEELTATDPALSAFHHQCAANFTAAVEQYGRAAALCYERGALSQVIEHTERAAACGASAEVLAQLYSLSAEAARLCGDRRAASFAERALMVAPPDSGEWARASRVVIAMFNPLAKGS